MSRCPELQEKLELIQDINHYLGQQNMANGFSKCDPGRVLCKELKKKGVKFVVQPKNWREAGPAYVDKDKGYHPSPRGMKNYVKYIRNYIEYKVFGKTT